MVGTFAACACRVCSRPGQGARSSALDALLGLGIGLGTEHIGFVLFFSFTYLRVGVGSEKRRKNHCVPEVPSAEQAK